MSEIVDDNMLTFDLIALSDWMSGRDVFDDVLDSIWNLFDDASIERLDFERVLPYAPPFFVTVNLSIVRKKAYYHARLKKAELELLIKKMREFSK